MSGIQTNRTNIDLPVDVSAEIIQKTQEGSAVMQLARQIALPGRGLSIPVITSDPEAAWVDETDNKPVSNPGLDSKTMRGYKLAVIVPFSNQFRRDAAALYDALVERLPGVLGAKFDSTVFGATQAPGDDFDTFASVNAHSLASDVYQGLVDADTDIALNGGITNGYVISPQGKGILLGATDDNKRPLFINNVAEGAVPMILGSRVQLSKGAYVAGSPSTVGFAGDWTKALYGIVEGVDISFSSDASLTLANGTTINLFQRNMFAVRAEIEVGFVADTSVFTKITASSVPSF
ncbi:MAG: phage major capsid protein [Clostridiales bacterium]|nr:phage major capsid protein [Clostridiales bacterium]